MIASPILPIFSVSNIVHLFTRLLLYCAVGFVLFFFLSIRSWASTSPSTDNLISVTPSIIQLDLGNSLPEAIITYTNGTDSIITISLSAGDITSLEEGSQISFLQHTPSARVPYTIANAVTFSENTLVLVPHASQKVFVIINKNKLTPGGHYGRILAKVSEQKASQGVYVQGILSSLLFVRTNTGKEIETANLSYFQINGSWTTFPTEATFQINDIGNVDITPYGSIHITDMFHRTIAQAIINDDSLVTLPQSAREYTMHFTLLQKPLLPGFYTATLALHYGKTMQKINQSVTFFSIGAYPFASLAGIILLVILIVLVIRYGRSKRS